MGPLEYYGHSVSEDQLTKLVDYGNKALCIRESGAEFLKGPVSVSWLHRANELGGQSLAVGLALWFKFGVTIISTVKMTHSLLVKFTVEAEAGRRALRHLESAGLVTVDLGPGRFP